MNVSDRDTVAFFAVPWYFTVDVLAVRVWHIWFYDVDKTIGIWFLGTAAEELLWTILVSFFVSIGTLVFAEKRYLRG